jgi:hypothetical protein
VRFERFVPLACFPLSAADLLGGARGARSGDGLEGVASDLPMMGRVQNPMMDLVKNRVIRVHVRDPFERGDERVSFGFGCYHTSLGRERTTFQSVDSESKRSAHLPTRARMRAMISEASCFDATTCGGSSPRSAQRPAM